MDIASVYLLWMCIKLAELLSQLSSNPLLHWLHPPGVLSHCSPPQWLSVQIVM